MSLLTDVHMYPVESKPLNNNPDTWNFGAESWMLYSPQNLSDTSALALVSSDPHVKKSKITPKSIFIAPNAFNVQLCPHGFFRVDDNGKCIKTVKINQDEILAARISELFGVDENPNRNSDIDSDYYDFDDESKSEKDSGPLQINLPLAIDIEEDEDGKKIGFIIEEKLVITMRNLNPKDVVITTEKIEETTTLAPVTEINDSVTEEPNISSTISTENIDDIITTTETLTTNSTEMDDIISTTIQPQPTTEESQTTTQRLLKTTTKIFSVDFMPQKSQRKSNRIGQLNSKLQNSRDRERPRKQKTTVVSTKSNEKLTPTKLYKIERDQIAKKNRTRSGSKRPGQRKLTTTTAEPDSASSPVTQKPFWWLPKGWKIDETKEKPILIRYWDKVPLPQEDQRARSHTSLQQRVNSRMPTDNIFREITAPEQLEKVLKK